MKIRCPNCGKEYSVREEVLDAYSGEISLPCPGCEGMIRIDLHAREGSGVRRDSKGRQRSEREPEQGDALKKRIFKTLEDLPPMPQVVRKAREVLSNPKSSFGDLARVIESDQGIVTRVLKMANSPYYGLSGTVSSVKHASVVLGTQTLMELLNLACSSELLGQTLEGYDLAAGDLWVHSLAVASGSQQLARRIHPDLALDAFSAGLIHDVGKIILDPYIKERKKDFQAFVAEPDSTFLSAERDILGFDHAELASEVCQRWQIPAPIVRAIRYHHHPMAAGGDTLSCIVHLADAAAIMSGIGGGMDGLLYSIDREVARSLKIGDDEILNLMASMVDYVEKTTTQI